MDHFFRPTLGPRDKTPEREKLAADLAAFGEHRIEVLPGFGQRPGEREDVGYGRRFVDKRPGPHDRGPRLSVGDVTALIQVSKSTWYAGVREGRYPPAAGKGKTLYWRPEDVQRVMDLLAAGLDWRSTVQ